MGALLCLSLVLGVLECVRKQQLETGLKDEEGHAAGVVLALSWCVPRVPLGMLRGGCASPLTEISPGLVVVARQLQNTSKWIFFPYPRTDFAVEDRGNEEYSGVADQKPLSFLPHVKVMEKDLGLYCAPLANSQLHHTATAVSFFCHVHQYCSRQEKMLYFNHLSDKQ